MPSSQADSLRRAPSGLRIALSDRIALLDSQTWNAVVQDRSWFFSRDYLSMLEGVLPEGLEPRYALVSDGSGPVAAVVMQWAQLHGRNLRPQRGAARKVEDDDDDDPNPLRRLFDSVARRSASAVADAMASQLRERVLICGNLLTYGAHAVALADGADAQTAWSGVAEVLYRVRRAEKLAGQTGFVVVKDLQAGADDGVGLLARVGYRELETEPNMVLRIDPAWRDHAGYLGSLASKYRSAVKNRVLAPIDAAGLALRSFTPDAALGAQMHALYLQVHQKAAMRPFTLHTGYFEALARAAGDRLRCAGIFGGDVMLGFIVTLLDGPQALAYHIGFDREAAARHPLYLRLLHASIEHALQLGAGELSFGRTALEPKSRLGAKPQAISVWVRHRQPVMNRLVKPLLAFAHHDEAPECHPFKAPA